MKDGALVNSGTVNIDGAASFDHEIVTNNGTIAVDSGVVLSIDTTVITYGGLINHGTINSVGISAINDAMIANTGIIQALSGVLTIDPILDVTITNSGTIRANGGGLDFVFETVQNAGTLEAINDSTMKLISSTVVNYGTVNVADGSELDLSDSLIEGGQFTNAGTVESRDTNLITDASFTNTGLIEVFGGSTLTITGTLLGNGTIQVDEGAELRLGVVSSDQLIVVDGDGSSELQFDADFGGQIQGLGLSDRLDLSTIPYDVHTTATFSWDGETNSGVLTSTNGSQSISLTLIGTDYTNAHLMAVGDGHGGTLITFNALDTAPIFDDGGKPPEVIFSELPDNTGSSTSNPAPAAGGSINFIDVDLLDRPTASVRHTDDCLHRRQRYSHSAFAVRASDQEGFHAAGRDQCQQRAY